MPINNTRYTATLLAVTASLVISSMSPVSADTLEPRHAISRYTSISTTPEVDQINPLMTVVSYAFPPSVTTVGQAVTYTLEQTGYSPVDASKLPDAAKIMLSLPLPSIQRRFRYVTVQTALKTLAGTAFVLMVDPINRQVTFVPVLQHGAPTKGAGND